jgi:ATP-dependent Lon protease
LNDKRIEFSDQSLLLIVDGYTREAGVRNLEREIGAVCRKVAREWAEGTRKRKLTVRPKTVGDMLGRRRFFRETLRRIRIPGVATGLAWTPVGGEVLFVEATAFAGSGKMQITGQLGDVMKESAAAAFSWVKGNVDAPENWFSEHDVHVHVPAGAIPKDGPSAGIAMATALTSLITGRLARPDTAMTGEVTLVGQVLPIGGLKEKALAAQQAGIKRVVAPSLNEPDIDDIPEHLRKEIDFIFVDNLNTALRETLEEERSRNGRSGSKRPSTAPRSRKKPAGSRR